MRISKTPGSTAQISKAPSSNVPGSSCESPRRRLDRADLQGARARCGSRGARLDRADLQGAQQRRLPRGSVRHSQASRGAGGRHHKVAGRVRPQRCWRYSLRRSNRRQAFLTLGHTLAAVGAGGCPAVNRSPVCRRMRFRQRLAVHRPRGLRGSGSASCRQVAGPGHATRTSEALTNSGGGGRCSEFAPPLSVVR